jgi:hypothetical protein
MKIKGLAKFISFRGKANKQFEGWLANLSLFHLRQFSLGAVASLMPLPSENLVL